MNQKIKKHKQNYEIELINIGSCIVEIQATSLKQAQKKAFKKRNQCDFNKYNEDCAKILLRETIVESDSAYCHSFTILKEKT